MTHTDNSHENHTHTPTQQQQQYTEKSFSKQIDIHTQNMLQQLWHEHDNIEQLSVLSWKKKFFLSNMTQQQVFLFTFLGEIFMCHFLDVHERLQCMYVCVIHMFI